MSIVHGLARQEMIEAEVKLGNSRLPDPSLPGRIVAITTIAFPVYLSESLRQHRGRIPPRQHHKVIMPDLRYHLSL